VTATVPLPVRAAEAKRRKRHSTAVELDAGRTGPSVYVELEFPRKELPRQRETAKRLGIEIVRVRTGGSLARVLCRVPEGVALIPPIRSNGA
jgi:hypothetical protein